ncbi:hypothetical protein FNV43_RR07810 [Rhamnella rubrinervis]|uniref:Uncharacterized protein n=1 Tax=Rhamnella rubrinervis TaxID=2594499 RepID=A0A8K0MMS3_9ROSA|nr:hypothetical protein FNV43_RR07810 [Rhamnella rubrinervis]
MSNVAGPYFPANSHRRRLRNPRRRRYGTPSTPLLQWKFDDDNHASATRGGTAGGPDLSVRKLAAGLWQLRFKESYGGSGGDAVYGGRIDRLGSEPSVGRLKFTIPHHPSKEDRGISERKNVILPKLESSMSYPRRVSERATKWDHGYSGASDDVYYVYSRLKLLKDQRVSTGSGSGSVVLDLQAKLVQARLHIRKLEAKRHSFKKKVKHFLKKLEEERISWQRREHEKSCADIDDLRNELGRERKSRQRMETVNTALINQLANAKLSTQQLKKDYEEEKKSRELMEEVCNELAKQIGEDKTEFERLKRESVKIREELEEERKMFQMVEVWREERVHMKLIDAKLALEDKFCQMDKLITELETFLRSRSGNLEIRELRKAEVILQEVKSVTIQDIEEFSYVPSKSDDLFSLLKELGECEANERDIEPCVSSLTHHNPKINTASPAVDVFNKNLALTDLNCLGDDNSGLADEAQGFDTVNHTEDQGSSYSLEGFNFSLKRVSQGSNFLDKRECEEEAGQCSPNTEISEVCSVSAKQSKRKASPMPKIWRSYPCNGLYKMIFDEGDRRLSTGTVSSVGTNSPHRVAVEEHEPRRSEQWITPELANPHITRGMKGCIEWPRVIQKSSLKSKLSEARIDSQKNLVGHVLKHKT